MFLGGIFLMKELSFGFFPGWLFSWPMILIAVGVFSGIKHGFRGGGWMILLLVGGFFLLDQVDTGFNIHRYIVPFAIICVGLVMITRPRRGDDSRYWNRYDRRGWGWRGGYWQDDQNRPPYTPPPPPASGPSASPDPGTAQQAGSAEDYIDSVSVLGGVKKVIVSKNFRGGEATSFLGGTELDFTQADINGTVVLELTQVMGGTKLIVPGNWSIRNEVNAVLGGVDDKRQVHIATDPNKLLILKGTSVLGGLEIRNY